MLRKNVLISDDCNVTTLIRLDITKVQLIWHSQHTGLFMSTKEIKTKSDLLERSFSPLIIIQQRTDFPGNTINVPTDWAQLNFIREENIFSRSTSTIRNRKIFLVHTLFPGTTEHPHRHTTLKCISNWTLLTLDCNTSYFWVKIHQLKKKIRVPLKFIWYCRHWQLSKVQAFWKSEHYRTFILDTVQLTGPMFAIKINIKDR